MPGRIRGQDWYRWAERTVALAECGGRNGRSVTTSQLRLLEREARDAGRPLLADRAEAVLRVRDAERATLVTAAVRALEYDV